MHPSLPDPLTIPHPRLLPCSHDDKLPKWFDEDERRFMRPQQQVRAAREGLHHGAAWAGHPLPSGPPLIPAPCRLVPSPLSGPPPIPAPR